MHSSGLAPRNVQITALLDVFGRRRVQMWSEPGRTAAEILAQVGIPESVHAHVFFNDELIPPELWAERRAEPRMIVAIRVIPGKSMKNPLRVVLGIVALAGAAFLPFLVPGAAALGMAIGRAALGLVGSLLLGSVAPPSRPRVAGVQSGQLGTAPTQEYLTSGVIGSTGGEKEALVPSITGVSNRANQYGPIPRVYAEQYRMYPVLAAQPVTEIAGNDQYLIMLFTCGYGPLDISDLRIGNTSLDSYDGLNYEICQGAAGDSPISLYPSNIAETTIGTIVTVAGGAVIRACEQQADRLSVDISFDQGLIQTNVSGKHKTVELDLHYRKAGSSDLWTRVLNESGDPGDATLICTDATTAIARRNRTWDVARDTYEVRVTRLTADNTSQYVVDMSYFGTLRAILNEDPINEIKDQYGNTVYISKIAMRVKATNQLNGVIDNLSCLVGSKLSTWNGSSWTSPVLTGNPAWIFADILTGTANKRAVSTSRVDETQLKVWADWCDNLSEQNNVVRRFNAIYDARTTVFEALRDVCAAGRASLSMRDGKFSVVIDQAQSTIVQHLSPRNTSNFSSHKTWIDMPHAVKVRFINPDSSYQQDERIVYDDGYNADGSGGLTAATKFEVLQLFGCTSADQAWKDGRYHMAAARLRPETYTVDMDFEHLVCTRGDLVRVVHDVPVWGLGAGRITALVRDGDDKITSITLDTRFELDVRDWGIRARADDGTSFMAQLQAGLDGEYYTLPLAAPLDDGLKLQVGDLVLLGEYDQESVELIVQRIEPGPDMSARVTLLDHAPAIYTADTGTIPAYDPQITRPTDVQAEVENAVILGYRSDEAVLIEESGGQLTTQIQVTMRPPEDVTVLYFEWQYKLSTSEIWSGSQSTPVSMGMLSIKPVEDAAVYDFRVRCQRNTGAVSPRWTLIEDYTVIGKTTPPPDVPVVYPTGSVLNWRYDESAGVEVPLDLDGFRIRYQSGVNTNWASATLAASLVKATQYDISSMPGGTLTVMVKAVDKAGNESINAGYIIKDFGDPDVANVVLTEEYEPDFPGTITQGTVVAGELLADSGGGLFWTGEDTALFWSGIEGGLFWTESYLQMTYAFDYTPPQDLGGSYTLTLDSTIVAGSLSIDYRLASQASYWDNTPGADANPYWTDDGATVWEDDQPWIPWPGSLAGSAQTVYFRLITGASPLTRGQVSMLHVVADVPDIVESLSGVVISAGGTRLPVTEEYRAITNVILTLVQDLINYPDARTVEIIDHEFIAVGSGPLIKVFDASHVSCAGKINAKVEGY